MKCANCDAPALWVYETPASADLPFCEAHLPGFLRKPSRDGLLTTTEAYAAAQAEVAALLAPEQEVVAEAEAIVAEAAAPKRSRKKAEPAPEDEPEA